MSALGRWSKSFLHEVCSHSGRPCTEGNHLVCTMLCIIMRDTQHLTKNSHLFGEMTVPDCAGLVRAPQLPSVDLRVFWGVVRWRNDDIMLCRNAAKLHNIAVCVCVCVQVFFRRMNWVRVSLCNMTPCFTVHMTIKKKVWIRDFITVYLPFAASSPMLVEMYPVPARPRPSSCVIPPVRPSLPPSWPWLCWCWRRPRCRRWRACCRCSACLCCCCCVSLGRSGGWRGRTSPVPRRGSRRELAARRSQACRCRYPKRSVSSDPAGWRTIVAC